MRTKVCKMKKAGYLLLVLACMLCLKSRANTDSLLLVLDQTIANQSSIVKEKFERIRKMSVRLIDSEGVQHYSLLDSLFMEYASFQYDSAFDYAMKQFNLASSLNDKDKLIRAKLNLTFVLRSAGLYKETFDSLNTILPESLPDDLVSVYYEQMARAYYDLAAYNRDRYYAISNHDLANDYADSAIQRYPDNSLAYFRIAALKAEANGNFREASFLFHTIVENFPVDKHQYAMACYSLGKINDRLKDGEEAIDMIIRAAIADIQSNTREAIALMEVANYLYNRGDIDRAYTYISKAVEDANFYGARQRILQASSHFPAIEAAKLASVQSESSRMQIILLGVSLTAIIILLFGLALYKQYKQLVKTRHNLLQLNEKLKEANTIKEEYIGHSFSKDAEYLRKLEKFKEDIEKKMLDRKFDDIRYVLRMFNIKKEQEALFIKFDELFLKLFPNFINHFNSFFNPKDQFHLKNDKALPVELRIFALIRIGITDHEQIASILRYSVRTVYNYKNIVKGKSLLPKDEFEDELMKLKTID